MAEIKRFGGCDDRPMQLLIVTTVLSLTALSPTTIPNFRDVGGMPAANGRVIRPGVLHRSGSPANASVAEAEAVQQQLGVRTVIDLRGEADALKDNGPRELGPITRYLPLLTSDMMRSALIERAASLGKRNFAKLILTKIAQKLSPSRRLRDYLGGEVDLNLARVLDSVALVDLYQLIVDQRQVSA